MTIVDGDGGKLGAETRDDGRTRDHAIPDAACLHQARCDAVPELMTIVHRQSIDPESVLT